jgi:hypothetical protein
MKNFYVGIDPGANGGFAIWCPDAVPPYLVTESMQEDITNLYKWMKMYLGSYTIRFNVSLEQVSGFIGHEHPGSRMFNFGMNYGSILMALTALGIQYTLVTPQKWQKELGIHPRYKKVESKEDFKRRLKELALKLFPNFSDQITLKTCDAVLLAYYSFLTNSISTEG